MHTAQALEWKILGAIRQCRFHTQISFWAPWLKAAFMANFFDIENAVCFATASSSSSSFSTLIILGIVCQDLSFSGKRTLLIITWAHLSKKEYGKETPREMKVWEKRCWEVIRVLFFLEIFGSTWAGSMQHTYDWCMLLMNLTFLYMGLCKNVRIINRQVQRR